MGEKKAPKKRKPKKSSDSVFSAHIADAWQPSEKGAQSMTVDFGTLVTVSRFVVWHKADKHAPKGLELRACPSQEKCPGGPTLVARHKTLPTAQNFQLPLLDIAKPPATGYKTTLDYPVVYNAPQLSSPDSGHSKCTGHGK